MSIISNTTSRPCFRDHTGTHKGVQVPANPLCSPSGLAIAIDTLTSPYNITCTFIATTQFLHLQI